MWIHQCNKGFIHCSPAKISMFTDSSYWQSDEKQLTLCFFIHIALSHKHHSHQIAFIDAFPINWNADVALVPVPVETRDSHLCQSNKVFVFVTSSFFHLLFWCYNQDQLTLLCIFSYWPHIWRGWWLLNCTKQWIVPKWICSVTPTILKSTVNQCVVKIVQQADFYSQ